ncbi:MAG: hypothetical protein ACRDF4_00760, partial [Rhabdochlamydiaceae bacterium]
MVKNKYLNGLLLLILFSGIVHVVIIVLIAALQWSIRPLNYFAILQFDYFFPGLVDNSVTDGVGIVVMVVLY